MRPHPHPLGAQVVYVANAFLVIISGILVLRSTNPRDVLLGVELVVVPTLLIGLEVAQPADFAKWFLFYSTNLGRGDQAGRLLSRDHSLRQAWCSSCCPRCRCSARFPWASSLCSSPSSRSPCTSSESMRRLRCSSLSSPPSALTYDYEVCLALILFENTVHLWH